jgi:hypothetical protein
VALACYNSSLFMLACKFTTRILTLVLQQTPLWYQHPCRHQHPCCYFFSSFLCQLSAACLFCAAAAIAFQSLDLYTVHIPALTKNHVLKGLLVWCKFCICMGNCIGALCACVCALYLVQATEGNWGPRLSWCEFTLHFNVFMLRYVDFTKAS